MRVKMGMSTFHSTKFSWKPFPTTFKSPVPLLILLAAFCGNFIRTRTTANAQHSHRTENEVKTKVVSGLYWEHLPTPIFYDTYTPLILEFKTPQFNKTEMTLVNWFNCSSIDYPYVECPMVFHFSSALQNLHMDFESIVPGRGDQEAKETVETEQDFFKTLTSQSSFCNRIQSHFRAIYTNRFDIDEYYLKKLEQCSSNGNGATATTAASSSTFYSETSITDYTYKIREPFATLESHYFYKFYQPAKNESDSLNSTVTGLLAKAGLSNSRAALQASLLASFYAERNRWHFAVLTCHAKKLPSSIVTERKLREILEQLEVNLTRSADGPGPGSGSGSGSTVVTTSIPLTSISKYYNLPLTDCTHTEDELIVRILVPLTLTMTSTSTSAASTSKKFTTANPVPRSRYSLRSVHTVPFIFGDKVCKLKGVKEGEVFLFDQENRVAYSYDVGRHCMNQGGLCSVDILGMGLYDGKEDFCVSAIFDENFDLMGNICELECRKNYNKYQIETGPNLYGKKVFIKTMSNSKLSISGFFEKGKDHLNVKCRHSNNNELDLLSLKFGSGRTQESGSCSVEGAIELEFLCGGDCWVTYHSNSTNSNSKIFNLKFPTFSQNKKECDQKSSFYRIFQTVPLSLLRKDKTRKLFTDTDTDADTTDRKRLLLENIHVDFQKDIDYEFITHSLENSGRLFHTNSAAATGSGEITSSKLRQGQGQGQSDEDADADADADSNKSSSSHWFLWTTISILCITILILMISQYIVIKNLMVVQGKSGAGSGLSHFLRAPRQTISFGRREPNRTFLIQDDD